MTSGLLALWSSGAAMSTVSERSSRIVRPIACGLIALNIEPNMPFIAAMSLPLLLACIIVARIVGVSA